MHYKSSKETLSNKKDLQSEIKFLQDKYDTEDKGKEWVDRVSHFVNIRAIISFFRALEQVTNVKVHRVVKTTYLLNVFISHYYENLREILETFRVFPPTLDYRSNSYSDNPFIEASNLNDPLLGAAYLSTRLRDEGMKISNICYARIGNRNYYVAIRDHVGISEFNYLLKSRDKVQKSYILKRPKDTDNIPDNIPNFFKVENLLKHHIIHASNEIPVVC
ncbi:hypothetical protein TVAG_175730 [Trichomonas vaginalis G3]|uniref:Uncharacterized protein n=1 Tax=Trichomonas vaginalis (strain ATCC PRA-98 / G3) TaxID=412133 RepID=A2F5P1_TRIV3|nr:hypothetical protein TVAGG3_1055740 [Trichomonas vaginalis G3]EAX99804.1 hypothetical protein TVAG_175730 [Trichomonas vaginalis G3]KAI5494438.1 hypothetical protein TVAGG3_1055740 [Trichomonas vaginalis G3]|eukprot:XP_001312734.1 hypothetical protein [Trichomonas vaginalis G3]